MVLIGSGHVGPCQRQLLAFARLVLTDPWMLILDEVTSSIDTRTEALIQDALQTLVRSRISLVIAHRLSTIRMRQALVRHDALVERATHEDLLRQGSQDAALY